MSCKAGETSDLVLFGTSACHLCDLAEELLQKRQSTAAFVYDKCDISGSDELFARYGLRIPVLQRADGAELGWPFSALDLDAFIDITEA